MGAKTLLGQRCRDGDLLRRAQANRSFNLCLPLQSRFRFGPTADCKWRDLLQARLLVHNKWRLKLRPLNDAAIAIVCRLEMCYKRGVAESVPHLPQEAFFEHSPYFREFLLTKRTLAQWNVSSFCKGFTLYLCSLSLNSHQCRAVHAFGATVPTCAGAGPRGSLLRTP